MSKIVGLGACVYDTLIECKNYPKEDCKVKAESIRFTGGGPVGNSLVVMSKLGIDASAIGLFADDKASENIIGEFKEFGVDTSKCVRVKNTSSFTSYILLSQSGKSRTCVFDRGSVPDDSNLVDYSQLYGADILHLDGNYLNCAIKACEIAKANKVKISLDAGGLYEGIEKLLPYVDILIPSAEFACGLTGKNSIEDAILKLSERYKPEVLVVTDGSNGGYYLENGKVMRYGSVKVNAIDTNGAGDTFHAGFLVAYSKGKIVKDCCRFASVLSAYKCTKIGLRNAFLDIEKVNEFINDNF